MMPAWKDDSKKCDRKRNEVHVMLHSILIYQTCYCCDVDAVAKTSHGRKKGFKWALTNGSTDWILYAQKTV